MKNLFNTKDLFRTKNLLLMISTAVFIITTGLLLFAFLMRFGNFSSEKNCLYHHPEWVVGKSFDQVEKIYGDYDYWDYYSFSPDLKKRCYFGCMYEYLCVELDSDGDVVENAYFVDYPSYDAARNSHSPTVREIVYVIVIRACMISFPLFFINLPLFIYLYCSYLTSDFHNKRVLKVPIPTEKQN